MMDPLPVPAPLPRKTNWRLIGRGIATMNTSVMLGVACMQTLSGMILGAFEPLPGGARTEIAYRSLFGFLTVILIAAVAVP